MYQITYKKSVEKDLRALSKKDRAIVIQKILLLSTNPRGTDIKKLKGASDLYRLRSSTYRVIYQIRDQELVVIVVKVGHRKDIYR